MPAEQFHRLVLDEVTAQATNVQMKLVELLVVEARMLIHPPLNSLLLGLMFDFVQLVVSPELGKLRK